MGNRTPFDAFAQVESDPMHSPSLTAPETADGTAYGLPAEDATHRPEPGEVAAWRWEADHNWRAAIHPAEGGVGGPSVGLGWTTGLRPRRECRPLFDGRTLVVRPGQANNPNVGQVGRDNHADRLAAGVNALTTDFMPSVDQIAASFTQPTGSALVRELQGLAEA